MVAGLFAQLPDRALFGGFARVDEAGGYFDRYGGEGRAELFLEENFGAVGFVEEGDDADAVDFGACGARLGVWS